MASLPTRTITLVDFGWSLVDGTVPGLLVLALGALVFVLRPGTPESRLFLAFCLVSATLNLTYNDLVYHAPLHAPAPRGCGRSRRP